MIPRSGGQYVYSRYALGEYAGFVVGWSDWISSCGSTATVALLIGQFSGALVPALAGKGPGVAAAVVIVDRKSTRLNSSHSQISYAVFCLKKKNKSTT